VSFQVYRNHPVGAHFTNRQSWHWVGEHPVHQQSASNIYRQKHSGIRATRADGIDQCSLLKHHPFARRKISGGHAQRYSHLFEVFDFENAVEKSKHSLVGSESQARNRPAREVTEANPARDFFHLGCGNSAAIDCTDQGSDTRPGNEAYRNSFFFQNLQDANVGDTASKPAA